jgi:hypothetical protein
VNDGGAGGKDGGAGVGAAQVIDEPFTGPPTTVSPIDVQFVVAVFPASVWLTVLVPDT